MSDPHTDAKISRDAVAPAESVDAEALVVQALRSRPSAFLSDVDGTLSPIAPTPAEAFVLDSCRAALDELAAKLELVAVLSGRPVMEARRMVGLEQLTYFGNHGLERWDGLLGFRGEAEAFVGAVAAARDEAEQRVRGMAGVRIEDKRVALAVHYRLAPDAPSAGKTLLAVAQELAGKHGLIVTEGKKVIELRPPLAVDKGVVVRDLIDEHGLNGLVYVGDDVTDIDAFKALRAARGSGVQTMAIAVGGPEVRQELLALADLQLEGSAAVGELLQEVARRLAD